MINQVQIYFDFNLKIDSKFNLNQKVLNHDHQIQVYNYAFRLTQPTLHDHDIDS